MELFSLEVKECRKYMLCSTVNSHDTLRLVTDNCGSIYFVAVLCHPVALSTFERLRTEVY